jgi:hypothetical protein
MALVACPVCQKRVSDRSPNCDHCGEAITAAPTGVPRPNSVETQTKTDETTGMNSRGPLITAASVVIGLALQFLAGGIWGFMLLALVLMIGVYLAYS